MSDGTVQSIEISAPRQLVYDVAADLVVYPDWATSVKSVEVLETNRDGLPARASFRVDAMLKEISYELIYEHDAPELMSWTAVPGPDIEAMEGSYEFTETDDGHTSVVYALQVETTLVIPGFLRKQAEKTLVSTALRGLKRRAEALASE
ncbi:MAG: SRPBCC family protein [Acidimicrobiia bacterium]|nr:SRPBCC family protein [Acidimicrobiia bacterium]MDH5503098.1 SRPBCC family protein [Acidimicrobiia bacterium]